MAQSSGRGTGAEDEEGLTPPAENFAELRLRIHRARGPWVRLHWREYGAIYFGKERLHLFDDPQGEYGVLYLAEDEYGAFVETFGRNPEKRLRDRLVAESEIRRRHTCARCLPKRN